MSNYNHRPNFNSPPMAYHSRNQLKVSPNIHSGNLRFMPYTRSPVSDNLANMRSPHNSPSFPPINMLSPHNSPSFPPIYKGAQRSFNNSTSSQEQRSVQSNQSYSSDSGSSSRFGDVSQMSPYSSPHRNSGSRYYPQNRNRRFQGRQNFKSPGSNDSNPGHSHDIRQYVHPSMLEDPWKDLMAEQEKK